MKAITLKSIILVTLCLVLSACSAKTSTEVHQGSEDESSAKKVENHKSPEPEKNNHTSPPNKTDSSKKGEPFKALPPAKDAKAFKTHYTAEEITKMPKLEAHGNGQERSIPIGQTLLKGMADQTAGPLHHYRMVSFYGNPHSKQMGVLGEYPPETLMKKLIHQAAAYSNADPSHPAIPTLELITTIAQRDPGSQGLYYHETPEKDIQTFAKLAKENGAILLLDVQLGRDTPIHQVKLLKKYLKLPYVYLAIDTEFHVHKGQVPGVNLGHINGADIQKAVNYVSNLVENNHLPDKVVVVHQFKGDIIQNKQAIKPTNHIEIALNYDGFGIPGSKMASYRGLVRNEPVQYGGFKLFYKNDQPLLQPKQVLQLDPAPAVIDYQ
ncbi:lipoprotein [Pullulanibacillus camelliae]|uniref:Lipoprotein n=1 Tax=Pullulanibacillus camelliae TaxID=1707096 RepID=A0A8J2YFD9_9BACL|nr:hypothetical protein [Pullulanibacillus camelliae]GGE31944.1 lipoprotein [Pullulanibacillus camelliae]